MEGAEKSDKASLPLQIDPKWYVRRATSLESLTADRVQPPRRSQIFLPAHQDRGSSPRLLHNVQEGGNRVRHRLRQEVRRGPQHHLDIRPSLIISSCQVSHLFSQAGLFSAISSAFVIDVHSNLRPDPNEQSAALLRAILLTLNQSAIPGETPAVPPAQEGPPGETVIVTCLMYASLLISMLAALVAMLGKQWLNRYLRNSGGSMIERCGDRQRKFDGLEKWPFHSFVESLPLMLQVSLLLLASGLCRHMWTISTPVAWTLISLTGLGVVFYTGIVIAGMSSYACPFQTPASIALRGPWKKVRSWIPPCIVHSKRVLSWAHQTWEQKVQPRLDSLIYHSGRVLSRIRQMWRQKVRPLLRRPPLSTMDPPGNASVERSEPWLKPKDLSIIRRTNTDDIICVSWILRHITDPEALDAALPLAGEIRWFDDGVDVNLPYDMIVSTFEACFDSTRRLYPGSRDRAYYSGRAILWIYTLALCKSEDFARGFPLPNVEYTTPVPDPDLEHLLLANHVGWHPTRRIVSLLSIKPGQTPSHSQWISNLLLHCSCANLTGPRYQPIVHWMPYRHDTKTTISLNTALNLVLVWCTLLGSPVGEDALMVQDKSYGISYFSSSSRSLPPTSDRAGSILDRLSKVVVPTTGSTPTESKLIWMILYDLVRLETTPERLTEITYEWCSVIYENRESVRDWEGLLLLCLETGFRHLDFQRHSTNFTITHTEHHQGLVDVVFENHEMEAVADLLQAWTTGSNPYGSRVELLGLCARHLVGLQNQILSSPRLRRLVIRFVELTEYAVPKEVGVDRFIEFLNHLHVTAEDIDSGSSWVELLLWTIQSSETPQHLSHPYWELLVELTVLSRLMMVDFTKGLQITTSLIEAEEWSKLECWVGSFWMLLRGQANPTERDLGHSMTLLFRQRPGAVQKLEQWVKRWARKRRNYIPNSFQQLCNQAHEAAKKQAS